jgi:pilus assembly protein CpaE
MQLKILIAGRNDAALAELGKAVGSSEFEISRRHVTNGHADPLYGLTVLPDVLVLHVGAGGEADLAEIAAVAGPARPPTIVVGPAGDTACMRRAMQGGARDYLEEPVNAAELQKSLERIRRELAEHRPARAGALFAVVGGKGGCGASFVAVNLAHIMAASSGQRVALLDLDLQFSTLGQYLDLKQEHGLLQALDMADQLDGVALEAYMAKHRSGLSLLGVLEDEMVLARDVPIQSFARLLDVAKANYDRVVVDLPRQVDDVTAAVYDRADRVLLVVQQEIANLRDAGRLRRILIRELGMPAEKLVLVVNRYDKNLSLELSDIRRALSCDDQEPILVPNHYRSVAESINVGVPMLEHARGSSVTKALMQIEARLAGNAEASAGRSSITRAFANLLKG